MRGGADISKESGLLLRAHGTVMGGNRSDPGKGRAASTGAGLLSLLPAIL